MQAFFHPPCPVLATWSSWTISEPDFPVQEGCMDRALVLLPAVSTGIRIQPTVLLVAENSNAECVLSWFNKRDAEKTFVQLVSLMNLLGWTWSQEDSTYKHKCLTMYFL